MFFFIEGNILWLGILAAYLIQISDAPGIIGRILNTGIYIPMVFLICSKVIKCAGTIILKEYDVLEQNIRWSILLLTLSLDICLFLLNWEMALFIAAILMGKFIWLDSGTAEILEYIKGLINCFKNTELTTAKGLSMLFGKCMISIEIWLVFGTVFMWVIGIISFS